VKFTESPIAGAFLIDVEPHQDERGLFARTYCAREFDEHGLVSTVMQCSTSFNAKRGTLRGLHYQAAPYEEAKLVRCTAGAIFDVMVDLRTDSATYRKWYGVELTASNRRMLYIPRGMAHGFQTIEDNVEVFYQISVDYVPEASRGVRWDDPILSIQWPERSAAILSERDRSYPLLSRS
jgi:dTDP-4-dehydrorhamnose 3,5-epimerase